VSANGDRGFRNQLRPNPIMLVLLMRIGGCMAKAGQTKLSCKTNALEKDFEYSRAFVRQLLGFLLTLPQTNTLKRCNI
jgi:hypothetical protein